MSKDEFEKFIEKYKIALESSEITPCNEDSELRFRSLASLMWNAGRDWEQLHKES